MKSVLRDGRRLAGFTIVMLIALAGVITAIERPVDGDTERFHAVFTDANGLKVGDDVRMFGVQVGKVESLGLIGQQAGIDFTMSTSAAIYENSRLAIRYQSLTGQRYVDVQQQPAPTTRIAPGSTIGVTQTVPSFDVTALFNGLRPVLATLSPESLNKFSESMLAVIEGDGNGIGPALAAIGELSSYVGNRQAVISTLIRNLSEASEKLGGRSPHLVTLLSNLVDIFDSLQQKVDGLIDFALTAPPVLGPLEDILRLVGLTEDENPDLENIIRLAIPDPQDVVDVLGRLPALIAGLSAAIPAATPTCGGGDAELPQPLRVLVAGQRVTVCNR